MATTTTTSAWAKPGAWALDSEEHEEELLNNPVSDFPSLSAAAAVVTSTKKEKKKKKKPQTLSLSEFNTGIFISHGSKPSASSMGLTHSELLTLPTAPRERSAQQLQRSSSSRLSAPFIRSYGAGGDEDSSSRWGRDDASSSPARRTTRPEFIPSKADEIHDWAAAKKSAPPVFDRRERGPTSVAAHSSRADESGSWLSKNTFLPSSELRRMGNAAALDRDREIAADSAPTWGNKRGQENGRPRLVLQPRTVPVSDGAHTGSASTCTKTNPFGDARPREHVLADKGQDWKKIDQQLDSIASDFGKKGFW